MHYASARCSDCLSAVHLRFSSVTAQPRSRAAAAALKGCLHPHISSATALDAAPCGFSRFHRLRHSCPPPRDSTPLHRAAYQALHEPSPREPLATRVAPHTRPAPSRRAGSPAAATTLFFSPSLSPPPFSLSLPPSRSRSSPTAARQRRRAAGVACQPRVRGGVGLRGGAGPGLGYTSSGQLGRGGGGPGGRRRGAARRP